MSFSSDIKEEILNNFTSKKNDDFLLDAEKFGEYLTVVKQKKDIDKKYNIYFDISKLSEESIKEILRGIFLSSGCIVNPQNDYHFEVTFKSKSCSNYVCDLLSVLDFTPKIVKREKNSVYVIYIKEAEQISVILSMLGATNCLLKYESIRVEKNVKNTINRTINCETANLSKTINSSVKQINAIKKIRKKKKFNTLNEKLQETAILREKYPNASLDELTKFCKYNISRSGLKHRLDKIVEIANNI